MPKTVIHCPEKGMTLVEMMVTIIIAAILVSIAVPNFNNFIASQRLQGAVLEFYSAVNLVRAEAIKRGAQVTLAANDANDWSSGWTIFIDENSNAIREKNETLVFTRDALAKGMTVTNVMTDTTLPYISYTGNGRSRTNSSSQTPQAGTVTFTMGTEVRRVMINFLGRARVCNPATDTTTCTASGSND